MGRHSQLPGAQLYSRPNVARRPRVFLPLQLQDAGDSRHHEIAGAAYPDPTAFDPKNAHYDPKSDPDNPTWMLVDVQFVRKFKHPLTLEQLKRERRLAGMRLLKRGNRLSVFPVDKAHWEHIHKMLEK